MTGDEAEFLTVGVVGKAHGLRGEVAVAVRTDFPDERFHPGNVLLTDPSDRGPLTVEGARWHAGRLLVLFAGVSDRTSAEAIRGTRVGVDAADLIQLDDPDEYYDHQLVGLAAVTPDGSALGEVRGVSHTPAGDLLLVNVNRRRREVPIPFTREIVPLVDLGKGHVVIDAPEGLLEL